MNTRLIRILMAVLIAAGLSAGKVLSQGASAVIDQALIDLTRGNHEAVMAVLQQQLEEAERQSASIQQQLDRMGDPRSVLPPAVSMAKEDILNAVAALKTTDEQRTAISGLTGAEVFDDDAFGLMDPIGSTVTLEDGTEVERDPEKYKLEAGLRAHLKEYYAIRDEAIDKQRALGEELANVLEQLETAEDFATVQKLGAMVTVLQGQIDQWNQKVAIAHNDVVMAEKEFQSTARVKVQGDREKSELQADADAEAVAGGPPGGAGSPPVGLRSQGRMPWGRLGEQTGGRSSTPDPAPDPAP